jgi:hypothetical protein
MNVAFNLCDDKGCLARPQSLHQRGFHADVPRIQSNIARAVSYRAYAPVEHNEEEFTRKSEGQPAHIIHYVNSAGIYGVTIIGH